MQEIWKDIIGYEGFYQVSNLTTVRSLNRKIPHGERFVNLKSKILKPKKDTKGYWQVTLCKDKNQNHKLVHRLFAMAFIPNPENKPQINHINGIKSDNRLENLEWCTGTENMQHVIINNLKEIHKGESHYKSRLSNSEVEVIRSGKFKQKDLAIQFGMHKTTISKIATNVNWKHL